MNYRKNGFAVLFCISAMAAGACTSVKVQALRHDSTGGTTTGDLPGFPNSPPLTMPVDLSNEECSEESQPNIEVYGGATAGSTPQIGRFPQSADDFVVYWTICNNGKLAQPSGNSYVFTVNSQQTNSNVAPNSTAHTVTTPFVTQTIPIPPLAACQCYVQEVGINMTVPAAVGGQANILGMIPVFSAQFPTMTVPIDPAPTPPFDSFNYSASLPSTLGTVTSLTFEIN